MSGEVSALINNHFLLSQHWSAPGSRDSGLQLCGKPLKTTMNNYYKVQLRFSLGRISLADFSKKSISQIKPGHVDFSPYKLESNHASVPGIFSTSAAEEFVGIHTAKNDAVAITVLAQGSYSDASFIGA